jgi:hypothetical protein
MPGYYLAEGHSRAPLAEKRARLCARGEEEKERANGAEGNA